ncbi:hypothetical protein ACBJ59_48080, partial [Nonomuraea sp. MTCD27]
KELPQARAHLQATHPDLYPAAPPPPPPEPNPSPATETAGDPAPGTPHQDPWTAPWDTSGTASSPSWTAPAQPWETPVAQPPPDDPALRAALIATASELTTTHTNVSEPVLTRLTRRRRIRVATWTTVSLGTVGAFVALVAVGVNAMVSNIEQQVTGDQASPYSSFEAQEEQIPDPLPAELDDPVQYATTGYCRSGGTNQKDPLPCAQWRLTTATGDEWRLPGARAGYDADTGATMSLALSQDGHRAAYRRSDGSYVVRDLRTGVVKVIDVTDERATPHFRSSPSGRYFSVYFEDGGGATLDFDTGVTHYEFGERIRILAVSDDGTRVVGEKEDVTKVPGHASITKLTLNGPEGLDGGYRVDPGLLEYGGALSPDGRRLALVAEDTELVVMDARTGRLTGTRADLGEYEVVQVERWLGADEVLIRQLEDDEYTHLVKVDVRSGTTTDVTDEAVPEELYYDDPLGLFRE